MWGYGRFSLAVLVTVGRAARGGGGRGGRAAATTCTATWLPHLPVAKAKGGHTGDAVARICVHNLLQPRAWHTPVAAQQMRARAQTTNCPPPSKLFSDRTSPCAHGATYSLSSCPRQCLFRVLSRLLPDQMGMTLSGKEQPFTQPSPRLPAHKGI